MGVEVLYGVYYRDHWREWIESNNLDYVLLNRPHITIKYIDFIKTHSNAKIIYYGHDLHFLREHREYLITRDPKLLESAKQWENKELDIMRKSDVVFTLSTEEQEIINNM